MMNGKSAMAWRNYSDAVDRLKSIFSQLETEQGRAEVLDKLSISVTRYNGDAPAIDVVSCAMAGAMKADAGKYLDGLIGAAQSEVNAAAEAVRIANRKGVGK